MWGTTPLVRGQPRHEPERSRAALAHEHQPLAKLLDHELTVKLEAEVRLKFDLYALDMVSRAQVVTKLTAAGVALPAALDAVGLGPGE